VEATWGTDFLGGRAHTEFAANYTMSPDAMYNFSRPWYDHDNRALYPCSLVNGGSATAAVQPPPGVYSNSFTTAGLSPPAPPAPRGASLTAIQAIGGQFATAGSGRRRRGQ